jgi:tetratricopeptide (TPR) repeat protein
MKKKKPPSKRKEHAAPVLPRHEFVEAAPTVIHHPEEKLNDLARVTHRLLESRGQGLGPWLAVAVGLVLALGIWNLASTGRTSEAEIWTKMEADKKSEDLLDLAKEYSGTPGAVWALYRAAGNFYLQAMGDMPKNRDVAMPLFRRALEIYDQVIKEAPDDSPLKRAAALCKARTLEARGELPKAIEQYNLVAQTWSGTPEADEAAQKAKELARPEAVAFYKELFNYKPPRFTLPPENTKSEAANAPPPNAFDLPAGGSDVIRVAPAPPEKQKGKGMPADGKPAATPPAAPSPAPAQFTQSTPNARS